MKIAEKEKEEALIMNQCDKNDKNYPTLKKLSLKSKNR